ncbi:MAG: hypothetical protein AB7P01_17680 [Bacteroidia bacterium]
MQEYKFKWGRVYYFEEGILCVEYIDDYMVDEEDVIEFHAVFNKQAEKEKLKLLVLPGQNTSATREAREYSQNSVINSSGEAIVINSLAQRIISNFYISFKNKAEYPIKMFNSKDEAVKWLKSL